MISILLATMIGTGANCPAQSEPPRSGASAAERLVPVPEGGPPTAADRAMSAAALRQDVVLQWNEVHLRAIKRERTPPPIAARNLAIVHAAIYDAVNAVERTHRPYRVNARTSVPASIQVAAAVAAHRALVELYPRRVEAFDAALDASLDDLPDGPAKESGMALGQHVAEKILAWRSNDGMHRRVNYTPRTTPGLWRPTPPGYHPGLLPQWRHVTPFAMPSTARFMPEAPPPLTSEAYTTAFREVKMLGGRQSETRRAEQTLIAWFWDDGEGSVTPPGHWNRIAQTAARQRGSTLAENARLFALLNITLADAGILCWECKFGHSYWRPITAIHEADRDDNRDTTPDRDWDSLLTTPPFPSYTSGHSSFSGAAATALARFFGTDAIRFTIGSEGVPGVTRTFPGFWAAASEAGRSRIYGGIHYEFDNQEGLRTGRALADYIAKNFLRPLEDRALTSSKVVPTKPGHFSAGNAEDRRAEPNRSGPGR